MRKFLPLLMCVLAVAACRKREERVVSKEAAPDIPREVALQKLGELLPTAESVYCTNPKENYKASEVKQWGVLADGLRIVPLKEKDATFAIAYADISNVRLDKVGKYFQVRLFSPRQTDPTKDLLSFYWRTEEHPARVVELIEALRLKK